jgi:hypothetical protein
MTSAQLSLTMPPVSPLLAFHAQYAQLKPSAPPSRFLKYVAMSFMLCNQSRVRFCTWSWNVLIQCR